MSSTHPLAWPLHMLGLLSPHYGTKRAILEGFNSLFVDNLIVLVAVISLTPFSQEKKKNKNII